MAGISIAATSQRQLTDGATSTADRLPSRIGSYRAVTVGRKGIMRSEAATSHQLQLPPLVGHADRPRDADTLSFLRHSSLVNLLSTPLIYSLAIPLALLDVWLTVYQWTCFPIYGIGRVRRRACFVIDRHKLPYLTAIEKLNCLYCSYATGLFAYGREIAARTEQYWCPIKHARPPASTPEQYQSFFTYGDAAAYHRGLPVVRRQLAARRRRRRHVRQGERP